MVMLYIKSYHEDIFLCVCVCVCVSLYDVGALFLFVVRLFEYLLLLSFLFAHLVKYLFTTLWAYISGIHWALKTITYARAKYLNYYCEQKNSWLFSFLLFLFLLYKWNTVFEKKNFVVTLLFCFAKIISISKNTDLCWIFIFSRDFH
jgi:hypothetical protein